MIINMGFVEGRVEEGMEEQSEGSVGRILGSIVGFLGKC